MRLDDVVREAVSDQWETSREIWNRHGYGAETSTSKHLNCLSEIGAIQRDTKPIASGFAYVYRRQNAPSEN